MLKDPNAIDVYADGICKDISKHLKRRGVKVKSKEGTVKKSERRMGWEVRFPEGTAKVDYNARNREWFVAKWEQNDGE
jgi:hypothetical protein